MIKEVTFKSFNERDTVCAWIYTPLGPPKGILQIVHGGMEHSRRYLDMIMTMLEAGFIVSADDHVSHGKTALDSDTWGDSGYKGYMTTVNDERTLRNIVTEEYPDLPFFLFGHSWGSLITRSYAANYGEDLAGIVLAGTPGGRIEENLINTMIPSLQELMDSGKAKERLPEAFNIFMEAFLDDRYELGVVSNDPNVTTDCEQDPLMYSNRVFALQFPTVQWVYDVGMLYKSAAGEQWASKVPKDLAVYNIGGDRDNNGDYGEGTYKVSNLLFDTGHKNVRTIVYPGMYHELSNEPEIREDFRSSIIKFMEDNL